MFVSRAGDARHGILPEADITPDAEPMAKATRTLSGAARDKYFRDMFGAEGELPQQAAERLMRLCTREISQLRVREPIPFRPPAQRVLAPAAPPAETPAKAASESAPAKTEPPAEEFDPYAFSLVTFFRRSGREALLSKLKQIDSVANLRKLAEAQHVMVPADASEADVIRQAIVEGTEQRLADRRAAAS